MLNNRTVFITGSNRGIGRVLAEDFAAAGASVIAHSRKESPAFCEEMKMLAEKYGVSVLPVFFDMKDTDAMKAQIKELMREKISVDILVNNAGIAHGGLFQMTPVSAVKEIFEINLFAAMELTQLILRMMTRSKSGCIINMCSRSGIDLKAGNSAYGVSKAAMIAWTKTLSDEVAPFGIRVNGVAPGLIDTDMGAQTEAKAREGLIADSSMKRLGKPGEVSKVVLFLASDDASFVNGQIIRVDGGVQ